MAEPFIGQIIMFGGNFAPVGYALCNGQLLPISQNTALFSLLGTTYGGNGTTTFALPNLQGRVPIHMGQGPGPSPYYLGQEGGSETVTLTVPQIPSHNHPAGCQSGDANSQSPAGNIPAKEVAGATAVYSTSQPNATMAAGAIGLTGGNQPHENLPPFLTLNFCIALQGIYPSRS